VLVVSRTFSSVKEFATNLLRGVAEKNGCGAESRLCGECSSTGYKSSESESGLHDYFRV